MSASSGGLSLPLGIPANDGLDEIDGAVEGGVGVVPARGVLVVDIHEETEIPGLQHGVGPEHVGEGDLLGGLNGHAVLPARELHKTQKEDWQ